MANRAPKKAKAQAQKQARRSQRPPNPLARLAYHAYRARVTPAAQKQAVEIGERARKLGPRLPVLVGYGGSVDGKKRPDGLAEAIGRTRRSVMRATRELERVGLVRIVDKDFKEPPTRVGTARGHNWLQRVGGRMPGGDGQANGYAAGGALEEAERPKRKAGPTLPRTSVEEEIKRLEHERLERELANDQGAAEIAALRRHLRGP